jgi:hypothetical protein
MSESLKRKGTANSQQGTGTKDGTGTGTEQGKPLTTRWFVNGTATPFMS